MKQSGWGENLEKLKVQDIDLGSQEKKNVEMQQDKSWQKNWKNDVDINRPGYKIIGI